MHTYNFTIPAGGSARAELVAEAVRCMSATGTFTLRVNGSTRLEKFGAGLSYQVPALGELIRNLVLENTSGIEIMVSIYAGSGQVNDNRLNLTAGTAISLSPGSQVDPISPKTWDQFLKSPPAGACVLATAANPQRRELIVSNDGIYDQYIRPNVSATPGGVLLPAGAVMSFRSSGAFFIFNAGDASNTTYWAEFFA
jgi:hypothetical protein